MPNLADELGRDYMDQFYKDAYFAYDGRVHIYKGHLDRARVQTVSCTLDGEDRWDTTEVPSAAIKNMGFFSWPKLGYRELNVKGERLVYSFGSTRSAMRGLKTTFLTYDPLPVLRLIPNGPQPGNYVRKEMLARAIFHPKYMTFLQGIEEMDAKRTAAFALNEDFAISIPVTRMRVGKYDVFYKGNLIGIVQDDGYVTLPRRLRKRNSVLGLFQGRVIV